MNKFYVYILTNHPRHTVLYVGFTDNLERRIYEHKNKIFRGFTAQYDCDKLVYFEEFSDKEEALLREKQLKKYKRQWKEDLINEMNNEWKDLYDNYKI
ncbi:MAG: GIY-YIG nuclease family protein [Bacteroidota bacterium]